MSWLSTEQYVRFLSEWNNTDHDYGVPLVLHELIDRSADRLPDQTAIMTTQKNMSYAELRQKSIEFAFVLQDQGLQVGDLVIFYSERSWRSISCLVAAARCGITFVSVSPTIPWRRVLEMCSETQAAALISDRPHSVPGILCLTLVDIDENSSSAVEFVAPEVTPEDLCFGIYTSGSTGRPKLSVTQHQGLCNRLLWGVEFIGLAEDDRMLCKSSLSFDVVLAEIFKPLIAGATLVLAPSDAEKDPWLLAETMEQFEITTVLFVPSYMSIFLDHANVERVTSLKRICLAGEAVLPELRRSIRQSFPGVKVFVNYGPSEASIDVTGWQVDFSRDEVRAPLGMPISNTKIFLLNEELQLARPGEPGQICLSGIGLSVGYLNRPEENDARFKTISLLGEERRVYLTGDIGRLGEDGLLEFLGREDSQVKIRGNRVELGEVEATLGQHQCIRIAAVLAVNDNSRLEAFVELAANAELDVVTLRKYCQDILPDFMVPSRFHIVETLPRTVSGKIDRSTLNQML